MTDLNDPKYPPEITRCDCCGRPRDKIDVLVCSPFELDYEWVCLECYSKRIDKEPSHFSD